MTQAAEKLDFGFKSSFKGKFYGILRWPQLDVVWDKVRKDKENGWYFYHVGQLPPTNLSKGKDVISFIEDLDKDLRTDHDEEYCGIVYVDDLESPKFIKVFDPNNIGTSCSISKEPSLPKWVISKLKPVTLSIQDDKPISTKRWLGNLFSK